MRYIRIFFLYFQHAFSERGRSVVWFFIAFLNPMIMLLFWTGATRDGGTISGWTYSDLVSYYFLLIIAGATLDVHIEEVVARLDIQEGGLTKHLVQPISYYVMKFYEELPWRIIQGFFGVVVFFIFRSIFQSLLVIQIEPSLIAISILVLISAYLISFFFKMIVGLSALWTTDYRGLAEIVAILMLIFGGYIMPLSFFHPILKQISVYLPFPYIIYYPIIIFQGKLTFGEIIQILTIQWMWITVLVLTYKLLWKKGIRLYTGIGQ